MFVQYEFSFLLPILLLDITVPLTKTKRKASVKNIEINKQTQNYISRWESLFTQKLKNAQGENCCFIQEKTESYKQNIKLPSEIFMI